MRERPRWRRLVDSTEVHGVLAWLDGEPVGFAHYYFHPSVWTSGSGYLQDLFVLPRLRRRGVGRALIAWLAREAGRRGVTRVHWHTKEDNALARAMYDKVTTYMGFIAYTIRAETPAPEEEPAV